MSAKTGVSAMTIKESWAIVRRCPGGVAMGKDEQYTTSRQAAKSLALAALAELVARLREKARQANDGFWLEILEREAAEVSRQVAELGR